jgi:hypothetical protein
MSTIRDTIKREAERRGLSAYAVGKLADVPIRTVQGYFAGTIDLASRRIDKLAAALGLELRPIKPAGKRKG